MINLVRIVKNSNKERNINLVEIYVLKYKKKDFEILLETIFDYFSEDLIDLCHSALNVELWYTWPELDLNVNDYYCFREYNEKYERIVWVGIVYEDINKFLKKVIDKLSNNTDFKIEMEERKKGDKDGI